MSLDSSSLPSDMPSPEATEALTSETSSPQVRFKSQGNKLLLMLPPNTTGGIASPWSEVWEQLKHRLSAGERFWQPQTPVYLLARDRLVDARQFQEIADALSGVELKLRRVYTSRRQTAVAAAAAGYSVEQHASIAHINQPPTSPGLPLEEPLYLQSTVRSGVEIRHRGTVVLLGDVNPGGQVIAEGDIVIWGRLKGLAHAGSAGNVDCRIMTLHMQPTQLRIADKVARPPETPPIAYLPEVAYVGEGGIRIAPAQDFARWLSAR